MSKKKMISSTKWEKSDFGGYIRLISDHPEIQVGLSVNYTFRGKSDLSYFTTQKLVDIFLLKVKEYKLIDKLLINRKIVKNKTFFGVENKVARISKESQREALQGVVDKDREYRSLFLHYASLVLSTDIDFDLPDKNDSGLGKGDISGKSLGKGEKDGSKSKDNKSESQQTDDDLESSINSHISQLIQKIAKKEPIDRSSITGSFKKRTKWIYPKPRQESNVFSADNERDAGLLVKLLDINFDPKIDRLNSLRSGKLDVRKIGEVPAGNLNLYYKEEPNQSTKPFSVVILQDESGSMGGYRMDNAIEMVKTLYLAFSEIVPSDKLSVYGHSGGVSPEIYVYKDPYNDTFETTINNMYAKSENYDGPVIEVIYDKIRSYTDDNIIFIVLSDGQPAGDNYGGASDNLNLRRIVEKCRRDGFVTVGIGIQYNTGHLYDYNCTINSLGPEMIKKTSYIINKVVKTEFQ